MPQAMTIRTVAGRLNVPVRDADLWLVSNLPTLRPTPYRISLHRGQPRPPCHPRPSRRPCPCRHTTAATCRCRATLEIGAAPLECGGFRRFLSFLAVPKERKTAAKTAALQRRERAAAIV